MGEDSGDAGGYISTQVSAKLKIRHGEWLPLSQFTPRAPILYKAGLSQSLGAA